MRPNSGRSIKGSQRCPAPTGALLHACNDAVAARQSRHRHTRDVAAQALVTPGDAYNRKRPIKSRPTAPGERGLELEEDEFAERSEPTDESTVGAIILGGGAGTRLQPLTTQRAKPAVPIAGAYRLIDVPMSNCLNSGIDKIYILTQYNSTSLNRHVSKTYAPKGMTQKGFTEVLVAAQSVEDANWFQGTADAVRQYSWMLQDAKNRTMDDIVILSGDHLYKMNYMEFVAQHRRANADITIGCLPCTEEQAKAFGVMKVQSGGIITDFAEKPKGERLEEMKSDPDLLSELFTMAEEQANALDSIDRENLDAAPLDPGATPYLASMGIYVFKRSVLCNILNENPDLMDFGGDLIPYARETTRSVMAYCFTGYWEDIGTIKTFFEANLRCCKANPPFHFKDPRTGFVITSPRHLPPAIVDDCDVEDSILSFGAELHEASVDNCIIGLRAQVGQGCQFTRVMMMGADWYESEAEVAKLKREGKVPIGVGRNCRIERAILDKNVRIGDNVTISAKGEDHPDEDDAGKPYAIKSGIVVVKKGATIPDGTTI